MISFRHTILYSLIFTMTIFLISCGEDDIPGCTNASANNFNSEATVDDGSCIISGCTDPAAENFNPNANQNADCIFARDRFIGTFLGSINCQVITQFNDDETTVLLEPVDGDISALTISLVTQAFTLPIDAVVDGNSFTMSLDNFPVEIDLGGVITPILLDVNGSATISDDDQDINGSFTATVLNPLTGAELLSDDCTLTATRN